MGQPREALPGAILRRWHRSIRVNALCQKAKEKRVNQSVYEEISEYGAPMSKWYDTVYAGRDLPPQPANYTPTSNRSNSKSHLEATSLTRRTSRRHSCNSKPGWLQEHVVLNLLGNEVIRLLRLSRSTVTSAQSKAFHRYNVKDYLYLLFSWNKNPLEVHHVLLSKQKVLSMIKLISHLWSNKYPQGTVISLSIPHGVNTSLIPSRILEVIYGTTI